MLRALRYMVGLWILMGSVLVACGRPVQNIEGDALAGRILLWHGWRENDAVVLEEIVNKFASIHPDVTVMYAAVEPEALRPKFETVVTSGLGPDLFIGPSEWVRPLAEAGLIQDLTGQVDSDVLQRYVPAAIESLRYQDGLYGLPVSLQLVGLYYNKDLVSEPAKTLDELLAQAAAGQSVALNTSFYEAFWGIQAFGGQLLDEEQRVVLDQGGFANWLTWLKQAQGTQGIILSAEGDKLKTLFLEEQVAYFVGGAWLLQELQATLGVEKVGVAPLPAGPYGNAGPFLSTHALMFSRASSQRQTQLALELAQFMTNGEQETVLMRSAGQVPANVRVKVDPRVMPAIAGFVAQAKTAVPLPNIPQLEVLLKVGSDAYTRALEGVQSPAEAAQEVARLVNGRHGFQRMAQLVPCPEPGKIVLWHGWRGPQAELMQRLVDDFLAQCPGWEVENRSLNAEELRRAYEVAAGAGGGPDVLLGTSEWIGDFAAQNLIRDVTPLLSGAHLQWYLPQPVRAMQYEEKLYGVPATFYTRALYYNRDLVKDPAQTLDDLLSQAVEGKGVALNTSFRGAYWGIPAFGGRLFDMEGRLVLDQPGFAEWLTWLQTARATAQTVMGPDDEALKEHLVAGEVAYYVGDPAGARELETALGTERVGVVPLPAGPAGPAGPLLQVEGFLFNAALSDADLQQALQFVRFLTKVDGQELLLQETGLLPVNVSVSTRGFPIASGFYDQLKTAVLLPNRPQLEVVMGQGNAAYVWVLEEGVPPPDAVRLLTRRLDQALGAWLQENGAADDAS